MLAYANDNPTSDTTLNSAELPPFQPEADAEDPQQQHHSQGLGSALKTELGDFEGDTDAPMKQ